MTLADLPRMPGAGGGIHADRPGHVYAIVARGPQRVKFGWALDPRKRLRDLQLGSPVPLVLACTMPGTTADEAALHMRLGHSDHYRGEWWNITPGLVARVQLLGFDLAPYERRRR